MASAGGFAKSPRSWLQQNIVPARKRRSKRRGKMFHALCEEFNERFAGKLELVYSKKLDPRYVQRATTGAHVCTAVDRSQD